MVLSSDGIVSIAGTKAPRSSTPVVVIVPGTDAGGGHARVVSNDRLERAVPPHARERRTFPIPRSYKAK